MRRDTRLFIRDARMGMIKVLAKAPNSKVFEEKISESVEVSVGQTVRYLITGAQDNRASRRVKAAELVNGHTRFDAEKYVDMLILAATNILSPFGHTERMLKNPLVYGEKQMVLEPLYA